MNEPNIDKVIKELRSKLDTLDSKYSYEIIVIDKSTDGTYEKALKQNVQVFRQKSSGYGNAYIEGFTLARGDILVMIDGDGSYSTEKLPEFIKAIDIEKVDFAIGNRFADLRPGSLTPLRRFGNYIITLLIRILFTIDIKDSQCGLRAFSRKYLENIRFECSDMNFASEMVIKTKLQNFILKNIPITYYPRVGTSKLSSWKHGFMIIISIFNMFFKYRILRWRGHEK